jgi:hypothetical protein
MMVAAASLLTIEIPPLMGMAPSQELYMVAHVTNLHINILVLVFGGATQDGTMSNDYFA